MDQIENIVGTFIADGIEYAVVASSVEINNFPPPAADHFARASRIPCLRVSRVFQEYENVEGIETLRKTYATPHWISLAGSVVVHWLPDPTPIVIEGQ